MSRLGKQPIVLVAKTEVSCVDNVLMVKGPKGTLSRPFPPLLSFTMSPEGVILAPKNTTKLAGALWGTYVSHIKNMLVGVTDGFVKILQVEGVGYRGEVKGSNLVMQLGFSHPVVFPIPAGVTVLVEKGTFTISGIDKEVVGQFAANVRAAKKPEPYKGKGVRYAGEYILRKQGKKAV